MIKGKPFIPAKFPPKNLKLEPFIKKIVESNRGIALFDGILRGLPNPDILLAPLTTNEAVLSSRIEGTQATFENVIQEEAGIKVVQLGLLHAQFEILHPFEDGNGRVGRLIIPLFLYWKGLISRPSFYLSEYLEKNRDDYYDKLLMITKDGDWSGWIDFFLTAVIEQSKENINKAQKLLNLYNEMKDKFRQATKSQYAIPALDAFFRQPIITTTQFKEVIGAPKKSSSNEILKMLEKSDLIRLYEIAEGNKPAKYAFIKILEIVGETEI